MPVNAIAMPYLLQVSITWSSRMEPPGCAMYGNAGLVSRARRCRRTGKKASEPTVTSGLLCNPRLLLLQRQNLRLDLEGLLPYALCQYVLVLVGDIDINRIVAVRTADVVDKLQTEDLRMLAQAPVVRLAARQTGAVDAALLARADADCLTVLDIADRVGLRVLQGDQARRSCPASPAPAVPCSR